MAYPNHVTCQQIYKINELFLIYCDNIYVSTFVCLIKEY